MRLRLGNDRWLSSVGFVLVLCCFAFPFAGWEGLAPSRTATYLGMDLVIGAPAELVTFTDSGERVDHDETAPRRLPAMTAVQPHATAALTLVVVGIALGAVPWRRVRALAAAATALAAVVLVAVVAYAPWTGSRPDLGITKGISHMIPTGAGMAFIVLVALMAGNLCYLICTRLQAPPPTVRPVHR
jgi:hypothetical protein